MLSGKTLQELAQELDRQNDAKRDFLADTRKMEVKVEAPIQDPETGEPHGAVPKLHLGDQSLSMTDNFGSQMSAKLRIPKQYYDRMRTSAPVLFAENVNHWLKTEPEKRMVRTLDGSARAFLSDRYRALDNYDLLQTALPIVTEHKCEVISCEVTENRMYLKALIPGLEAAIKVGDVVKAGIVISNSEVGAGSLRVEPFTYRLICTNGMISQSALRRYHVGRRNGTDMQDIMEVLSDKTKQISDAAFWMQVQDVIKAAFKRELFDAVIANLKAATERPINGDPVAAVQLVKKNYGFTDEQGSAILKNLIKGGDLTQWGIANAVTATANTMSDYETATTFERTGGKIIELPQTDWKRIAEAAA